jgi:hypothetical protein
VLEYLGRHIEGRAYDRFEQLFVVVDGFGEAEVCDLERIVVHEQVGRFHISVHDVPLPQVVKPFQNLPEVVNRFDFCEISP